MAELEATLATSFVEVYDVKEDTAAAAASKAASFAEDHDEDLTAEAVLDALETGPYESFRHNFDWVIGDLAAAVEDCTDSRAYRLSGFGDLAANPEQGA